MRSRGRAGEKFWALGPVPVPVPNFFTHPPAAPLPSPAQPPADIPGVGGKMSHNQDAWKEKWEAQVAKAHEDLGQMLAKKRLLEQQMEDLDTEMVMQLRLMELLTSQMKPP